MSNGGFSGFHKDFQKTEYSLHLNASFWLVGYRVRLEEWTTDLSIRMLPTTRAFLDPFTGYVKSCQVMQLPRMSKVSAK